MKSPAIGGAFLFYKVIFVSMEEQLLGAFIISVLHGFIPGHWLPFIALAKKLGWTRAQTLRYTGLAAIAHAGGTVIIGLLLAKFTRLGIDSEQMKIEIFGGLPFESIGGISMVILGVWFLYRHHKHHHFHFPKETIDNQGKWAFGVVMISLFLSPCMEIESYFFTLAPMGWTVIFSLVAVYSVTTWLSMMGGVWIGFKGLERFNSHRLEHSAGLITGIVMILSGLMLIFA